MVVEEVGAKVWFYGTSDGTTKFIRMIFEEGGCIMY